MQLSSSKLDVTKTGNGERGTGSGEREARTGSRERGRGNSERVTGKGNGKKGAGNDHPQTLRFAFVKKTDATINSSGHKQ